MKSLFLYSDIIIMGHFTFVRGKLCLRVIPLLLKELEFISSYFVVGNFIEVNVMR